MRDWSAEFNDWYGVGLPEDYLVFDMETTGLQERDLPVDIGHCIVRGKEVVNQGSFILNWADYPGMDVAWLEQQFRNLRKRYAEMGKTYHYTVEQLRDEGKPPDEVLWFYRQLFEKNRKAQAE